MQEKQCKTALTKAKEEVQKIKGTEEEEARLEVHAVQSEEQADRIRKKFSKCKEDINLVLIRCY